MILLGFFGLVQLPQLALQPTQPLVAGLVGLLMTGVMVSVLPFFMGGLLGMADEAISGRTRLATLLAEGKANYVTLLIAYLAIMAVNIVIGFMVMFVVIIGGVGLYVGESQPNIVLLGVVAMVGLVFVLAYLLVFFFIQFYAHAIVLSDTGLIAGFKESVGLVRRNLVSVLGYTVIVLVGSLLFGGIGGVASVLLSPRPTGLPIPDLSLSVLVGAAIVYVLALAIMGGFYATYSVAFYRSIDAHTHRA